MRRKRALLRLRRNRRWILKFELGLLHRTMFTFCLLGGILNFRKRNHFHCRIDKDHLSPNPNQKSDLKFRLNRSTNPLSLILPFQKSPIEFSTILITFQLQIHQLILTMMMIMKMMNLTDRHLRHRNHFSHMFTQFHSKFFKRWQLLEVDGSLDSSLLTWIFGN